MKTAQAREKGATELHHSDVGVRLRALRIEQGLSVNELAMRAGVSAGGEWAFAACCPRNRRRYATAGR